MVAQQLIKTPVGYELDSIIPTVLSLPINQNTDEMRMRFDTLMSCLCHCLSRHRVVAEIHVVSQVQKLAAETRGLVRGLNDYFQSKVNMPRIRMGNNQEIETLINEEALLFAQYLRNEKTSWIPRIATLN